MYGRILVAFDGSPISNLALKESIGLAKEMRAELRVVHVIDEATLNWNAEVADIAEIQARTAGEKVLSKAASVALEEGVKAETKLLEIETRGHRVSEIIVREAAAWPADLIVIGTHGRRGFSRLFLGSVAEGVARIATKPVLLVRSEDDPSSKTLERVAADLAGAV